MEESIVAETWRPVVGYEGIYEVSDQGRVKSVDRVVPFGTRTMRVREKIMQVFPRDDGYLGVRLRNGGAKSGGTPSVHSLMCAAFYGPCPVGHNINHDNGIKTDNRLSNLAYVTFSENSRHAVRTGLAKIGEHHGRSKITEAQALDILRSRGQKHADIAARHNVSRALVGLILTRKIWKHLDDSPRWALEQAGQVAGG